MQRSKLSIAVLALLVSADPALAAKKESGGYSRPSTSSSSSSSSRSSGSSSSGSSYGSSSRGSSSGSSSGSSGSSYSGSSGSRIVTPWGSAPSPAKQETQRGGFGSFGSSRSEPKPAPRVETPRYEPRREEPKRETRPEPKVERGGFGPWGSSKPEPRVETPRNESRREEPKRETKPESKVERGGFGGWWGSSKTESKPAPRVETPRNESRQEEPKRETKPETTKRDSLGSGGYSKPEPRQERPAAPAPQKSASDKALERQASRDSLVKYRQQEVEKQKQSARAQQEKIQQERAANNQKQQPSQKQDRRASNSQNSDRYEIVTPPKQNRDGSVTTRTRDRNTGEIHTSVVGPDGKPRQGYTKRADGTGYQTIYKGDRKTVRENTTVRNNNDVNVNINIWKTHSYRRGYEYTYDTYQESFYDMDVFVLRPRVYEDIYWDNYHSYLWGWTLGRASAPREEVHHYYHYDNNGQVVTPPEDLYTYNQPESDAQGQMVPKTTFTYDWRQIYEELPKAVKSEKMYESTRGAEWLADHVAFGLIEEISDKEPKAGWLSGWWGSKKPTAEPKVYRMKQEARQQLVVQVVELMALIQKRQMSKVSEMLDFETGAAKTAYMFIADETTEAKILTRTGEDEKLEEIDLATGTILRLKSSYKKDRKLLEMVVLQSEKEGLKAGDVVLVSLADVQEMQNELMQRVEDARMDLSKEIAAERIEINLQK